MARRNPLATRRKSHKEWRMGQSNSALYHMASALIAAGALTSCGDGTVTLTYSVEDKGLVMPQPQKAAREKCYGIALAQHNDCAAGPGTDCAGTADKDYMPDRWKYVPRGNCTERGGSLVWHKGEPTL
jgi:uncharacterized membrane protein